MRNTGISIGGYDDARKPFIYVDFTCGAWGARPWADGLDGNSDGDLDGDSDDEAAAGGGQVVLEGSQILHEGRPAARWVWSDTGRGLQAHELEHLFDPFFSGRQAGRGLGFGLAKAWRIATLHDAILRVTSPVGCSAVLTLIWPLDT